jgi:predicted dehydrogenase
MSKTRIAMIGAGGVALRHATTLQSFDDVSLVGVFDVAADRAEALATEAGTQAFADADALLESGVDGAYVCVPPFAHGDVERDLIERGIPFFVEKPLALDLETAEDVAARLAERGLVTATGYHWRYLEGVQRAAEILADSPARLAIGAWLDKVPPPAWWIRRTGSGGQTIEQTTHLLDTLRCLLGEVEQVHAIASRTQRPAFPDADIDDVSAATLRFASGAVGSVASTCLLAGKLRAGIELFCDGPRLEIGETGFDVGAGFVEDGGNAKIRVDRDFVDAVQGRVTRVRAPYSEALETHRLGIALVRSAAEDRTLRLKEPAS